ncbi:MAG: hypothetical protein WC043_02135 [Pseudobdellovibrionaceae bacterium]
MRMLLSAFALILATAPAYAADMAYDPEGNIEQSALTSEQSPANPMENMEPASGMPASASLTRTTDSNYDPEGSLAQ